MTLLNLEWPPKIFQGSPWTNASAHAGWGFAIPAMGYMLDGPLGAFICGCVWLDWSILQEFMLHGGDGSEKRTDLISRCIPTCLVLLWTVLK